MLAVFCLAVIALGDLVVPKPKNPYTPHQKSQDIKQLQTGMAIQEQDLKKAKSTVSRYVWNVGLDQITSKSLDSVTALAAANKVQLQGFRPPVKTTIQNGLTHIPYLILVSGPFLNVVNFEEALEDPKYKLAIEMVQFASSDSSSDQVNASIGVIAYTLPNQEASSNGTKKK
jgi:hypothetical protein